MKNPNSKEDLIAIIERLFEEIDDYRNGDGDYEKAVLMETRDERLDNELEKLTYEFKNGSK